VIHWPLRRRWCALIIPALCLLALASTSSASTRTARLNDGLDPTLTYDIERVDATLDRAHAQLRVSVRLYRPFPTAFDSYNFWYQGVSVTVAGSPSILDCRWGSDTVGAVHLSITPTAQAPTEPRPEIHEASARVSYRQAGAPVPLSFSTDRRTAFVTVDDELLNAADLRCLSVNASGQSTYDPRQPNGGPSSEGQLAAYFSGFAPQARLKRALRACDTRYAGRKRAVRRASAAPGNVSRTRSESTRPSSPPAEDPGVGR
jgi:hypothetical protein